jgi:hypothetical protein
MFDRSSQHIEAGGCQGIAWIIAFPLRTPDYPKIIEQLPENGVYIHDVKSAKAAFFRLID